MSKPTTTKTFTLSDLAKIALGAPELTNEHLRVLQSLLLILLQKLNCHNESVYIKGFSAKCLQKLLNEANDNCQLNFQFHNNKGFQEMYKLLEDLERKTLDIQSKMEKHFDKIRSCHKTNRFNSSMWDYYAAPDEDLCTLYMKQNKEFCLLARNSVFNKEIRGRASQLMVERLQEFDTKIEKMQSRLKETWQMVENSSRKEKCIESTVKDIQDMRLTLEKNNLNFRNTMSETQEMLNCKLDRVALPALKKFLEQRFGAIKDHLRQLKIETSKCSSAKHLSIDDKKTCLSCDRSKDVALVPQLKDLKSVNDNKCFCSNLLREPTILERIDRMKMLAVGPATLTNANRLSRQSAAKKAQLKLDNHGILTNYGSSSAVQQQDANKLSTLKNTLKKQPISGNPQENSSPAFAAAEFGKSETAVYSERTQSMPAVLSRQDSKHRSAPVKTFYYGNFVLYVICRQSSLDDNDSNDSSEKNIFRTRSYTF